jgi:hypothetical protein
VHSDIPLFPCRCALGVPAIEDDGKLRGDDDRWGAGELLGEAIALW